MTTHAAHPAARLQHQEITAPPAVDPYQTSWEQLSDELRRLDLRILRQLLLQRAGQPVNPLEQFKGLVVTEQEVVGLLDSFVEQRADSPELERVQEQIDSLSATLLQRRELSKRAGIVLSRARLSEIFSLNSFEEDALLIAVAPELNRKYEKLYAYLHDDVTRKQPTVDLVLTLLCPSPELRIERRGSFHSTRPLLRYRMIELCDSSGESRGPLLSRGIKLDDRIAGYLLGGAQLDARIEATARLLRAGATWGDPAVPVDVQTQLRQFLQAHFSQPDAPRVTLHLRGAIGSGSGYLAECICAEMGLPLLVADIERLLGGPAPFEEALWLVAREACLQPAALAFENVDVLLAGGTVSQWKAVLAAAHTFCRVSFLFGQQPWRLSAGSEMGIVVDVPLRPLDVGGLKHVWENRLAACPGLSGDIDVGALASKFRLSPGQINEALIAASNFARWRSPGDGRVTTEDLHLGCRAQSGRALESLARKVEPHFQWNDIVLPAEALAQLREVCDRVRQRHRVFSEWGFDQKLSLGRGVNALFAGPSGTGKTMAAEILAQELGLDLYKIDLSGVVSKYIGETEKNLSAVFAAAENSNAILFFDEADSLFGKRSEVRDSHDRYANLEISYLLQKMEEYDGVAILATNLRQNLDESFLRRLTFTIHFPFPEEADRRRIWDRVWPEETPRASDVDLDLLARQFKLSGGNIKNVALAAAFMAASNGGELTMKHLLHGMKREFQKMGRVLTEEELHQGGSREPNARTPLP